jgi:transcriptional regulator with PAS, ATPase and Fis domain
VPAELAESTLFGHTKGSFTGAWNDKKGYFDMAEGGTLFLDEIGDMPGVMQAKLLRVLEDRMVMPVGGSAAHPANVRVIAATNADLNARVADGKFRTDLFYRLAAYEIKVQPLRERREDIAILAAHFMTALASQMGIAVQNLGKDAVALLEGHDYPGNVRELKNVIERALIESGGLVNATHIHFPNIARRAPPAMAVTEASGRASAKDLGPAGFDLKNVEEEAIERALKAAGGNMSKAARLLGIDRTKLYRRMPRAQGKPRT